MIVGEDVVVSWKSATGLTSKEVRAHSRRPALICKVKKESYRLFYIYINKKKKKMNVDI